MTDRLLPVSFAAVVLGFAGGFTQDLEGEPAPKRRVIIEITDPDFVDPEETARSVWSALQEGGEGYDSRAHARWAVSVARFERNDGDHRESWSVLAKTQRALSDRSPDDFVSEALIQSELAEVHLALDDALRSYRARVAAAEALERGFGEDHPDAQLARLAVVSAMHLRSTPTRGRGYLAQSLRQTQSVIARAEAARGPHDPVAGVGHVVLASLEAISQPGNLARVDDRLRAIIEDEEHAESVRTLAASALARIYDRAGQPESALKVRNTMPYSAVRPNEPVIVYETNRLQGDLLESGALRTEAEALVPAMSWGLGPGPFSEQNMAHDPLEPRIAESFADISYCVQPSGDVVDVKLQAAQGPDWWRRAALELVATRKFQAWKPEPGEGCLARRERLAVHAEERSVAGSKIAQPMTSLRLTRRVLHDAALPSPQP